MNKYLQEEDSVLHSMFTGEMGNLLTDSKGRVFIDRDGVLFRLSSLGCDGINQLK